MIKVTGVRGSSKTSKLIKLAARENMVLVEPNKTMADYAEQLAKDMGITDVEIITAQGFAYCANKEKEAKYLIDELDLCLNLLKVYGYSNTIENTKESVTIMEPKRYIRW